jgi:hypothetical protein
MEKRLGNYPSGCRICLARESSFFFVEVPFFSSLQWGIVQLSTADVTGITGNEGKLKSNAIFPSDWPL